MKILSRLTDKSSCLQDSCQSKETVWRKSTKCVCPQRQQQLVPAPQAYQPQHLFLQRHRLETEISNLKVSLCHELLKGKDQCKFMSHRPFSKMAAENLNKLKLKTYTSTRKSTFTLVTLQSFSISGVISAEKI